MFPKQFLELKKKKFLFFIQQLKIKSKHLNQLMEIINKKLFSRSINNNRNKILLIREETIYQTQEQIQVNKINNYQNNLLEENSHQLLVENNLQLLEVNNPQLSVINNNSHHNRFNSNSNNNKLKINRLINNSLKFNKQK